MKIDIRCDKGAYTGSLSVNDWDIMQPLSLTPSDFDRARKRLTGFSEVRKSYSLESVGLLPDSAEDDTLARVQRFLNIFVVQGAGVGELLFAGAIRKGLTVEEKVLITILFQR